MKVSQITESNVLSLWLGDIGDFGDLDEYIWGSFEEDFGIEFEARTAPEADAHETPIPVRELIEGFSFSDQWIANAMNLCEQAGWREAKCAVILFNVRYPQEFAKNKSSEGALKFMGNVEWDAF